MRNFIMAVLLSPAAYAAEVGNSVSILYGNQPTVQGESIVSIDDARKIALSKAPRYWVLDYSWTSATVECVESSPLFFDDSKNDFTCDWKIPNNRFRFSAAIKESAPDGTATKNY